MGTQGAEIEAVKMKVAEAPAAMHHAAADEMQLKVTSAAAESTQARRVGVLDPGHTARVLGADLLQKRQAAVQR